MSRTDGPHRNISVKRHRLTMGEKRVRKTVSIAQALSAPSYYARVGIGEKQNAVEEQKIVVNKENQEPESEHAERERFGTDDMYRLLTLATNENIDEHQWGVPEDSDVHYKNDDHPTPGRVQTQRRHFATFRHIRHLKEHLHLCWGEYKWVRCRVSRKT